MIGKKINNTLTYIWPFFLLFLAADIQVIVMALSLLAKQVLFTVALYNSEYCAFVLSFTPCGGVVA